MFNKVLSKNEANLLNPLVWAYVGDAVHSLYMRQAYALGSDVRSGVLHGKCTQKVSANGQAVQFDMLFELFTEQEKDIARRARNAKTLHVPKGASLEVYKKATALEAVVGFLYMTGEEARVAELLSKCLENNNEDLR